MHILLAILTAQPAQAGAWVHAPDSGWAQLGYAYSQADHIYDESGTLTPMADEHFLGSLGELFSNGAYQGHELAAYAEYGLKPDIEVFGSLPIRVPTTTWTFEQGDNPDVALWNFGLGDLLGGVRTGLTLAGGQAASVSAAFRVPLYDNASTSLNMEPGNMDFYDDQVPLGEGTIDLEVQGAAGTPLGFINGWFQMEGGVRLRNRGYSTALPGRLQLGLTPTPGVSAMANVEGLFTLDNGEAADFYIDEYGKGPLVIDGQQWLKGGLGMLLGPFHTWGVNHPTWRELGVLVDARTVLSGKRTSAASSMTVALTWQR